MVNLPGRDRRRRVLKDEVLAASNNYATMRAKTDLEPAADAPRYSDAAGVENHPQITDFIPRRYSTIAVLVAIGLATTAALAAAQMFLLPMAAARGMRGAAIFSLDGYGSLASWLAAVVLALTCAICLIVLSIRRHRIDDFKGRYRVWLGAAIVCLFASANSVAGLHQMIAELLGAATGWTALRDGAVWWLTLAGLPVAWITLRAILDVRECRLAGALLIAAVACYAVSVVSYLGLAGIADPQTRSISVGATLLMGHWFVLAAIVSYARFVVLDAQGLITVRRRSVAKRPAKVEIAKTVPATSVTPAAKPATSIFAAAGLSRSTVQSAKTPADSSRWVDGSRPERDRYDRDDDDDDSVDGDRKLSKADRKRLRKLKAQGRAA
jgi:hypothetical protein